MKNISKRIKDFKFSKYTISIILILLLGAFLRLYKIKDYIVFLGDEGRDALVVYNILHGDPTLLGPTSSVGGFFLGPIYYYLMAPFLWLFNYDPVGPAIMVVLFGIATIFLVYKIGSDFFGKTAGLIAALLYAVSPVVIIYSRSSWNPNVFPFFTLSSLYALYLGVKSKKWYFFVLGGFLMGINLQIHYLATFVGAMMFFYILFADFRIKIGWITEALKRYVLMLIGFVIGFAPFLAFEFRHQFANTQNIFRFIFESKDTGVSTDILMNVRIVFERLFGGIVLSYPTLPNQYKFDSNILIIWGLLSTAVGITAIAFLFYKFIKTRADRKEYHKYILLVVWLVVGIGLFLFYKKSVYDYYLGFLYPLPFILIVLVLANIESRFKKIGMIIAGVIVFLLVFLNLKFTPIAMPGNQQVNQMKQISEFVMEKSGGKPYNFAISGVGNSDHAYRYFFRLAHHEPVMIGGINVDPERKTVTDQLFVVCERIPCSPLGESSNEIAGFGRADIGGDWNVSVVKVYKLIHYKGEE